MKIADAMDKAQIEKRVSEVGLDQTVGEALRALRPKQKHRRRAQTVEGTKP